MGKLFFHLNVCVVSLAVHVSSVVTIWKLLQFENIMFSEAGH